MIQPLQSPRISHLSWGNLEVEKNKSFKDAKLYPGGMRKWDWKETGTNHESGIQPADVEELLERGSEVIILSQGMYGRLQVKEETVRLLKMKKIQTFILTTKKAVDLYNDLRKTKLVGGLFHTTC